MKDSKIDRRDRLKNHRGILKLLMKMQTLLLEMIDEMRKIKCIFGWIFV